MKVKTKVIQARISERLLERFDAALEWEGVSRSDVILQAIREYIDKIEKKKGEPKVKNPTPKGGGLED